MAELLLRPRKRYTSTNISRFTVKEIYDIVSIMSTVVVKNKMDSVQSATQRLNAQLCMLLQKISNKDKSAFEEFYDSTIKLCFSQALRVTGREDVAEEVVGDVYMRVWNKASSYDEARSGVTTWLMMLCRSRALDTLRHRKSHQAKESVDIDVIAEPSTDVTPQDILNTIQQDSALHAAMSQLKPQQRQFLSLAYFKGLTHNEISNYTEIPLGTVKTQIRRAILVLKELMHEQDVSSCSKSSGEPVL